MLVQLGIMAAPPELTGSFPTSSSAPSSVLSTGAILAFNWMQLSGAAILTLILIIVALSPRLSRLSTWYSFCLSWILSSLSYCLLYISGQQTRPEPDPGLCVFQSGLIYAAPVLTVGTTLSFVIHIYLKMCNASSQLTRRIERLLQITPYLIWLIVTVTVIVSELMTPVPIRRLNGLYCSSTSEILSRVIAIIVLSAILLVAFIQATIFYMISVKVTLAQSVEDTQVLAILFRVFLFNLGAMMGLGVSVALLFLSQNFDTVLNLLLASFPLLVVAIFGLQRDILYTLIHGKFKEKSNSTTA